MPKYIANTYLKHYGKIVKTGGEVELTAKQAERLGEKVTIAEGEYIIPLNKNNKKDKKESK